VHGMSAEDLRGDLEKGELDDLKTPGTPRDEQGRRLRTKVTRTWYGRKKTVVVPVEEEGALDGIPEKRAAMMLAPITNGLAFGLSICECDSERAPMPIFLTSLCYLVFIGNGINTVLIEWQLDGDFVRFALFAFMPLLFAVSLVRFVLSRGV
jgi:hypothetical protein